MCRLVLPGVRTCSPLEEGIPHAWMGELVVPLLGRRWRGRVQTTVRGGEPPRPPLTTGVSDAGCKAGPRVPTKPDENQQQCSQPTKPRALQFRFISVCVGGGRGGFRTSATAKPELDRRFGNQIKFEAAAERDPPRPLHPAPPQKASRDTAEPGSAVCTSPLPSPCAEVRRGPLGAASRAQDRPLWRGLGVKVKCSGALRTPA